MKFKVGRYYRVVGHSLSTIGPVGMVVRCRSVSPYTIDSKPISAEGVIVRPPSDPTGLRSGDVYWMSSQFSKWARVSDEEGMMYEMGET